VITVANRLSIVTRALPLAWCVSMTVLCFTLFTWIVHDRRMPGWPDVLDRVERGPLVDVAHGRVAVAVVADAVLFALFGLVHAGAARRAVYLRIGRRWPLVPRQALRTVFITVTAVSWLALMPFWPHTATDR
jgi:hypothetical protein